MKRILITGASRGIGRAIAQKLAAQDTVLFLHGRDRAALTETQRLVEERGARGQIVTWDLSDAEATKASALEIAQLRPEVLINNAGIAIVRPLSDVSLDEWQRTFATNVTAPFILTQILTPFMPSGSSIVNILSVAAKTGFPGWSSYCMSKFALEGFSQSVREELRPRGIRVINIYPAATDTEIWNGVAGEWPREKMISAQEVAEAVGYALSRPAEVAIENITLSSASGTL